MDTIPTSWTASSQYLPETLVTDVRLDPRNTRHSNRGANDTVASHDNIFFRVGSASTNLAKAELPEVRVFLHHDFRIYENNVGDTAFYDPETLALIHYKKHRYFLINTEPHFDAFAPAVRHFAIRKARGGMPRTASLRAVRSPRARWIRRSAFMSHSSVGQRVSSITGSRAVHAMTKVAELNTLVLDRRPRSISITPRTTGGPG